MQSLLQYHFVSWSLHSRLYISMYVYVPKKEKKEKKKTLRKCHARLP